MKRIPICAAVNERPSALLTLIGSIEFTMRALANGISPGSF
jgi:hypothetical protein